MNDEKFFISLSLPCLGLRASIYNAFLSFIVRKKKASLH
jgi:hypothetical protein